MSCRLAAAHTAANASPDSNVAALPTSPALFAPGDRVCMIPACIAAQGDGVGLDEEAVLAVVAVHPNHKWRRYTVRSEHDGSELTVHEAELVLVAH